MPLEDHLGDIIAKARAMTNVTLETAAQAAGLPTSELEAMEDSGQPSGPPNYEALARLLDLDGAKLRALAGGWRPVPRELTRWQHLAQIVTTQGGNAVNAYLVWDDATRKAALFDTGWNAAATCALVAQHQLRLRHLFITHSHTDHVAALGELTRHFAELQVIRRAPDAPISVGSSLHIEARATPGHAADGLSWIITGWSDDAPPVAVVGDAIFAGSIGRGFQSWLLAREAVRQQIFSLPPETLLCPGHGPVTTVAEERASNPFFPSSDALAPQAK